MTIKLGDKARDKVTGFTGIVFVRSEYLSGCTRVGLQPPVDKEGKVPESQHFDEPMLELVKAAIIPPQPTADGGPRPVPRQHAAPPR